MSIPENKLESAWWALRIGLGAAAFLAGLAGPFTGDRAARATCPSNNACCEPPLPSGGREFAMTQETGRGARPGGARAGVTRVGRPKKVDPQGVRNVADEWERRANKRPLAAHL